MQNASFRGAGITCILALAAFLPRGANASTVSYSGKLIDPFGNASDDFVIVGTFRPDFNVNTFGTTYGDSAGNFQSEVYNMAVNDGTFRPIGGGTLASSIGAFSGSGTTTGIDGLQIYLWAFDRTNPDQAFSFAWISGTGPSWRVTGGGSTTIDAATADQYLVGFRGTAGAVRLDSGPIPEPTSAMLIVLPMLAAIGRSNRRCT